MVNEPRSLPYAPPSSVIDVLSRFRTRNLPDVVDIERLMAMSVSRAVSTRVLSTLRFLGLVGESGEPTSTLRGLVRSTDEDYRETLSGVLRNAYAGIFEVVDPSQDRQEVVLNAFRRFEPASQHYRMSVLFLGLCREAGIPVLDEPRQRRTQSPSARPGRTFTISGRVTPPGHGGASRGAITAESAAAQGSAVLWGYFRRLPKPGGVFPDDEREAWLEGVKAAFNLEYSDAPHESPEPEEGE